MNEQKLLIASATLANFIHFSSDESGFCVLYNVSSARDTCMLWFAGLIFEHVIIKCLRCKWQSPLYEWRVRVSVKYCLLDEMLCIIYEILNLNNMHIFFVYLNIKCLLIKCFLYKCYYEWMFMSVCVCVFELCCCCFIIGFFRYLVNFSHGIERLSDDFGSILEIIAWNIQIQRALVFCQWCRNAFSTHTPFN